LLKLCLRPWWKFRGDARTKLRKAIDETANVVSDLFYFSYLNQNNIMSKPLVCSNLDTGHLARLIISHERVMQEAVALRSKFFGVSMV